jgi:APA family basic amino acid/polyamine antiporter
VDSPSPKKLSPLDATLLVMGGIIGVGIFFTPSQAAGLAFEPWAFLSLWIFGGVIAMCAAFTFAELGGTFPETGGWFVYLREAFGRFPAFLFAWIVLFVVSAGAAAAVSTFCADMLHVALPSLVGPGGSASHHTAAVGLVLGVTVVGFAGVKRAALIQNACMVTKLLTIAALILCGFVFFNPAEPSAAVATVVVPPEGRSLARGMLGALLPVFFAYGGWQMVSYIAPQVEEPAKTLPRAIVFGVLGVVVVYFLANLAFVTVLGIDGLAAGPDFASRLARESVGPLGERLLAGGMAISALGWCIVTLIGTPWLYVAMAKEGLFFARFGRLHPTSGAPLLGLSVQAVVVLVYLAFGTIDYFVKSVVFVEWIFHGLVALALLRLRSARKDLPRPYTSPFWPLAPVVYALAAGVVVLSTLWTEEPVLKYTGLGIIAAGALLYRPWRWIVGRAQS